MVLLYYYTGSAGAYGVSRIYVTIEVTMAAKTETKTTTFFRRVDEPLPIRWTSSAEPPKKPKRRPGRPRKIKQPVAIAERDSETSLWDV